MSRNGKVIIAMSGGVDSSVAASLLLEQGYAPVGVFMWTGGAEQGLAPTSSTSAAALPTAHRGCCSAGDACDARAVAARLGIPFYTLNFAADFAQIIDYFVSEYARARTPNPCVICNTQVKFGKLLAYADAVDAEFIATGHYARVLRNESATHARLAQAVNLDKDQSYALFGMQRDTLDRCLLPIGEIADKTEVRRLAASLGLDVADKHESQEICFVPDDDYKSLVRARRPDAQRPGDVIDTHGNVLGTHDGIANYTIGQRRGLGIAAGAPIYVTHLDPDRNTVTVGPRDQLLAAGLLADQLNWLTDPPTPNTWHTANVQIRYNHRPVPATFRLDESCNLDVRFDHPQPAVTPGQAAVLYRHSVVLGGGWISRALPTPRSN